MRLKLNEHENIRPVETKDQGVVPTVYADAVEQMEKVEKIKDETTKIQEAPKHEEKGKNPKMAPGAKKMKLDESLFDFEDDDLESEYEVHYVVHSDVDENNIKQEFDTEEKAIEYARENKVDETWVDEVIYYPETNEEEVETIWTYQDDEIEESTKEKSVYETIMEGIDDFEDEEEIDIDTIYHDASEDELRRMGAFNNLNREDITSNESAKRVLEDVVDNKLDAIQDFFADGKHEDLMNELGEAIGSLNNVIDMID